MEAKKQNDCLKKQIERLERITQQQQDNLMPVEVKKQADQQEDDGLINVSVRRMLDVK